MKAAGGAGAPAAAAAVVERLAGRAVPVRGNDIDTDRIIPARFLRCVTFDGIEAHAFEDDRKATGGSHPFDRPCFRGASLLIVNRNFGCGSSREHAPQSLLRWGIRGLIGESFAEIFFGNCVALGVPCVTLAGADVAALQAAVEGRPELEVAIDLRARPSPAVACDGKSYAASIPPGSLESFLTGSWDATGLLLREPDEIEAVARSLPYTGGMDCFRR
jgi:3-isopropylmalate/(R)-2-methylmalate dehydratase small subunit